MFLVPQNRKEFYCSGAVVGIQEFLRINLAEEQKSQVRMVALVAPGL
jgi:hypothetical protein